MDGMRTFSLTLQFQIFLKQFRSFARRTRRHSRSRWGWVAPVTSEFSSCRPEAVGGCMGRADLFSCSLRILGSPISLILKSEIRHIPVGARRTRCQLEQCSESAAPVTSPHGGPVGVGDGGMRIPSLDSPISNYMYLKASLAIRTTHAPSHAPPPALALRVGRTCLFSSRRPEAVGRWMGLTNLNLTISTLPLGSPSNVV